MKKQKHIGINSHRLKPERENLEEVRFAEAWQKHNDEGRTLDHLLHADQTWPLGRPLESTDTEVVAAATVIQWLGSPVGQSFLLGLGYEKNEK